MVGVDDRAGTEVDVDEEMNKDFFMKPERALQTTRIVYFGEASGAVDSFNKSPEPMPVGGGHSVERCLFVGPVWLDFLS